MANPGSTEGTVAACKGIGDCRALGVRDMRLPIAALLGAAGVDACPLAMLSDTEATTPICCGGAEAADCSEGFPAFRPSAPSPRAARPPARAPGGTVGGLTATTSADAGRGNEKLSQLVN